MFKKIVKGLTLFAAVIAVTFVSSSVVKAETYWFGCDGFCSCGSPESVETQAGSNEGYALYQEDGVKGQYHYKLCRKCGKAIENTAEAHHLIWWMVEDHEHLQYCDVCGNINETYLFKKHTPNYSSSGPLSSDGKWMICPCTVDDCTISMPILAPKGTKKEEVKEEKKEESKHEEPARDLAKEAFGGRAPEALSVEEQKTAVSYALANLRAGGLALPVNTVKASGTNNGSSDIAAVVADNRDAINQQVFAQVMCQNLGFKNITPLKTYNMYALHATYDAKTKAQTITWANTGLKFGDTAFVVWYNQKLGKIELLPAVVGPNGDVAVSVPALGDVSTMTVVKAN